MRMWKETAGRRKHLGLAWSLLHASPTLVSAGCGGTDYTRPPLGTQMGLTDISSISSSFRFIFTN